MPSIRSVNWRALRERYAAVLVALLLVVVIPSEIRQSLWRWALRGSDVLDVIVAVLILTNVRSMGEHGQSNRKLDDLNYKLENGIKHRLDEIEQILRR